MADDDTRAPRSRTVTWDDPAVSATAAHDRDGLDYLAGVRAGGIPLSPFGRLLGYRLVEIDAGRAVFELEPGEHLCNPQGKIHGGVLGSLLDSAMGSAVHSRLGRGAGYATVEIKVNFVRPLASDVDRIRCEAGVIHLGGRIATVEGRVTDGAGTLYAHGVATFMIFRSRNLLP